MTEPCCIQDNLGYVAWHADAERRAARGEKQKRCLKCRLYYWPALQKKGAKR